MSVKPLKIGQKFFVNGPRSINKPIDISNEKYMPKNDLDVEKLFSLLSEKIDSINIGNNSDIYGDNIKSNTGVIDVDIQREILIGDIKTNAIKSEEVTTKVETKVDKLRKLRNQNGS